MIKPRAALTFLKVNRRQKNAKIIERAKMVCAILALCTVVTMTAHGQTFSIIADFNITDGSLPIGPLAQGPDGNFYGTTNGGGGGTQCSGGCGTIFRVTPAGTVTTLYSFCAVYQCADGSGPYSGLVLANDGNFYGTTFQGGPSGACAYPGCGTIFKITPQGVFTTLYAFCSQVHCSDGADPYDRSGLVQGADGNLYGTTYAGGANCYSGCGTIFKISLAGQLTTLYSFCPVADCADGYFPSSGVVQGPNGDFYGTAFEGGVGNGGTFYKITSQGTFTTLHTFCHYGACPLGGGPEGALVMGVNGSYYGIADFGGSYGGGAVIELSLSGGERPLYNFCARTNCADGLYPSSGLTLASDGNFYGTTSWGGVFGCYDFYGCGTLFRITPTGQFATLYSFCDQSGCGYEPESMMQATNGNFYGTTYYGGIDGCQNENCGTVFELNAGLSRFIAAAPGSGKEGMGIILLGTNLTGAEEVSFNGTPAAFRVVSGSEIKTAVPIGATTGDIEITTTNGILRTNVPFHIY
jgi:uncharacterized repeat protein (TIGR03803 family)